MRENHGFALFIDMLKLLRAFMGFYCNKFFSIYLYCKNLPSAMDEGSSQ